MFHEFKSYGVEMIHVPSNAVLFRTTQGAPTPAKALVQAVGGSGLLRYMHRTGPRQWQATMGDTRWVVTR